MESEYLDRLGIELPGSFILTLVLFAGIKLETSFEEVLSSRFLFFVVGFELLDFVVLLP